MKSFCLKLNLTYRLWRISWLLLLICIPTNLSFLLMWYFVTVLASPIRYCRYPSSRSFFLKIAKFKFTARNALSKTSLRTNYTSPNDSLLGSTTSMLILLMTYWVILRVPCKSIELIWVSVLSPNKKRFYQENLLKMRWM